MDYQKIIVDNPRPQVRRITLNRPDKLNAMTKPMWTRLGAVMEELSATDDLRCVVLRGAGGKAFSPGNDISEFETERTGARAKRYDQLNHAAFSAVAGCLGLVRQQRTPSPFSHSSFKMNSSISRPRALAKPLSSPATAKPHFSRTRMEARLSLTKNQKS